MWAVGLLMLQTVGAGAGSGPAQDPATTPVVEVALRRYGTSGPSGSSAGDSGPETASGYLWSDETLCTLGASSTELSFTPSVGWHVTARITRRTGDEFGLFIEWERIGSVARQVTVPRGGGGRFTLRMGDHVELDRLEAVTPGPCQAGSLRLEAGIRSGSVTRGTLVPPGSVTGVASAGGGGRGGFRGGAGAGGAVSGGGGGGGGSVTQTFRGASAGARPVEAIEAPQPVPQAGPTVQSDDDLLLKMTALTQLLRAQALRGNVDAGRTGALEELRQTLARPKVDAEVWLVHRLPNGTEDVQRQAARFASRATIAFAPVSIATARGTVSVDVTAVLQLSSGTAAPPLSVGITRHIRGAGSPTLDSSGGSDRVMALPKSDQVLSFELPPFVGSMRDLLAGHTFSLRLRIGPAAPAAVR